MLRGHSPLLDKQPYRKYCLSPNEAGKGPPAATNMTPTNRESRHFQNHHLPHSAASDTRLRQPQIRPPSYTPDAQAELHQSLTRLTTINPPVQTCSTGWSFSGLYTGPTSIAYLFLRLSDLYPAESQTFKGQTYHEWAESYAALGEGTLRASQSRNKYLVDENNCGVANEHLSQLVVQAVLRRDASLARVLCATVTELVVEGSTSSTTTTTTIEQRFPGGSDEWLYGRAGLLYLLRVVRQYFHSDVAVLKLVDEATQRIVRRILNSPQPWTWSGSVYLGAAHGAIGILCQLLLSAPEVALRVDRLLGRLLGAQLESGNWPGSMPSSGRDELVQFCHGAPGFVTCLESVKQYFPDLREDIEDAMRRAREDICRRGLLRKEPSLCHGIPGNALTLRDDQQLAFFLSCMTSEMLERQEGWLAMAGRSDDFAGLYTGEAGRAWTWAVADLKMTRTFIGFNDL